MLVSEGGGGAEQIERGPGGEGGGTASSSWSGSGSESMYGDGDGGGGGRGRWVRPTPVWKECVCGVRCIYRA